MSINLSSLNTMRDSARVLLNNDGSFSKASIFTRRAVIDENKENIAKALKDHIKTNPDFICARERLCNLIDTMVSSKMTKNGISVKQIKDIMSYAQSMNTKEMKAKAILSRAVLSAYIVHGGDHSKRHQIGHPDFLNAAPQSFKDAYKEGLHKHLHTIVNGDGPKTNNMLAEINQFCNDTRDFFDKCQSLDLDANTAQRLFVSCMKNDCGKEDVQRALDYTQKILNNSNLNLNDKNALIETTLSDSGPISQDKFNTALLEKENASFCTCYVQSDSFNTELKSNLEAMGFKDMDNISSVIKDAMQKSSIDIASDGKRADETYLKGVFNNIVSMYASAKESIVKAMPDNRAFLDSTMRGLSNLKAPPSGNYLKDMPLSIQNALNLDSILKSPNELLKNAFSDINKDFLQTYDVVAKSNIQTNFLIAMKHLANDDVGVFDLDITRGMDITLSYDTKIPNNKVLAKEYLINFVKQHDKSSDDDLCAKKAHILMSFLSQEAEKIITVGGPIALSQTDHPKFLTVNARSDDDLKRSMNLRSDGEGGFFVDYTMKKDFVSLLMPDTGVSIVCKGAQENYDLCMHIDGSELTRLAKIDINAYKDLKLPDLQLGDFKKDYTQTQNFGDLNIKGVSVTGGMQLDFAP